MAQKHESGFQITYVTLTYRSVFLGVLLILALIALGMSFAFPSTSNRVIASVEAGFEKVLSKVGLGGTASGGAPEPGPQPAYFTNIDGAVRVKKASSNNSVPADYSLASERDHVEVTRGWAYHLRISRNVFFAQASVVFDRSVSGSQITLALPEGSYYWGVETVGENGKESVESPKSRFSLIPKVSSKASIALELSDFLQCGHAIKVKGWTESGSPGHGQRAGSGGESRWEMPPLHPPLPSGDNMITVTAQNAKGGVNTKQQSVTIQ